MNRAEHQRTIDRDRYLLEELPQDPRIRVAFQEAAEGKRGVLLVVKGFRPMYERGYPHGFNYFLLENDESDYVEVPVPTACRLANINPRLVQDAYFHFRNDERWPRRRPELDEEIGRAQTQIVTNLFPFPAIELRRENGSTGEIYPLGTVYRMPPFLREEEILEASQSGKAIAKAFHRYLRRQSREYIWHERHQVRK